MPVYFGNVGDEEGGQMMAGMLKRKRKGLVICQGNFLDNEGLPK